MNFSGLGKTPLSYDLTLDWLRSNNRANFSCDRLCRCRRDLMFLLKKFNRCWIYLRLKLVRFFEVSGVALGSKWNLGTRYQVSGTR